MSATAIIEFDDVTEHVFDASKLTLLNDKGQLQSLVKTSEVLFANYDGQGDGTVPVDVNKTKRGGKTLTFGGLNNTGQVSNGLLEFPNLDRSTARYANITDIVDDFAFRARVQSKVATVASDRHLVRLISNVDNTLIRFYFQNQGGGITRMRASVIDGAGSLTGNFVLATKNMSTDPNWNIAFSNDDDGNILIWVDGVLEQTIASPTMDLTDCDFIFGDDDSGKTSVANFDNVQLFKANEITQSFAFPFPEPTTYDLTENTMVTALPLVLDEVTAFDIVSEIPSGSNLKHYVLINFNPYYHDGTNWVPSNGTLANANTTQEIIDNFSTLPITKGIGASFQVAHIFQSTSGYDTPLIEQMTVKYKFQFKAGNVPICTVYGDVKDNAGMPVEGATIRVQSNDRFLNNAFIGPSAKALSNAQGKFTIGIPETETAGTTVDIFIEYTEKQLVEGIESDVNIVHEIKGVEIPNQLAAAIETLSAP